MKANQLTSLVHRNIPPQEQQHCHRSALLKTILAAGSGGAPGVSSSTSGVLAASNAHHPPNHGLGHHHPNHAETKFEMNFSNGKLGLAPHIVGNNNNTQAFGNNNNNNNTISLNNNASTTNNNNNNAPLDLSIDAAIKEVVSKDDKDLPATSISKLSHHPLHHLHHSHHSPIGGGGLGGGGNGDAVRRLTATPASTPARFPSLNAHNNSNKDSFGDKTNFSCFKQRGEEPQPSVLPAHGLPTPVASPVHSVTHPQQQQQPLTFFPSASIATTTAASSIVPSSSAAVNLLPRNNVPTPHLQPQQQHHQQQQQPRTSSDIVYSSSSLSSTSLSLASFHKDVQEKSAMEGGRSSGDHVAVAAAAAAAAVAQKRQRGSKISDHGRVRRKRQTLQEMARPLKEWMEKHLDNPYPSKGEKQSLAHASNMTLVQVANWFANARRRLKIAEGKSGGDLAAKLAAISQSDHPIDRIEQMDVDEDMEDADASEGEGELTIDLGGGKQSTITMPQQQQQLPPEPSREADLTAASEAERLLIARQQQQRNSGGNNNNSILQRYLNELPETEAALTAANKTRHDIPSESVTAPSSSSSSSTRWMTESTVANLAQQQQQQPVGKTGSSAVAKNSAGVTPAPFVVGVSSAASSSSQYQHHRRSPGPPHRRSPGMGSVSSHDFEDCGQASSETSSTSGPLDWTFNGSANGDHSAIRSSPSPPKMGYELFDEMNAIEIDAALALVALSRMRQHEKQQRQLAASSSATSHARRSDDAGVTTLSFANKGDAAHGATIRVRQKH